MTRDEAKAILPLMEAYSKGKTIQIKGKDNWFDLHEPDFRASIDRYRIKPEPKYRPFKNQEECWNEMLKHEPFGWIMGSDRHHLITSVDDIHILLDGKIYYTFEEAYNTYKFVDGASFGIKEE